MTGYNHGAACAGHQSGWRRVLWDGEVNLARLPAMLERMFSDAHDGERVVVDLSEVAFLDGAGLAALVQARVLIRSAGGDLLVSAPSSKVRWMFSYFDFDDLVETNSDERTAGQLVGNGPEGLVAETPAAPAGASATIWDCCWGDQTKHPRSLPVSRVHTVVDLAL